MCCRAHISARPVSSRQITAITIEKAIDGTVRSGSEMASLPRVRSNVVDSPDVPFSPNTISAKMPSTPMTIGAL